MVKIDKERTWIYSPVNNIVFKVSIKGCITEEQLKEAIINTVSHYEMLQQRIIVDEAGIGYYDKSESLELVIESMKHDWKAVAQEQEKLPFAIDKGEFLRFFYCIQEKETILLIIAHHIAGDGISFTYFIQDIMRALSGMKLEYKKLSLFDMDSLPKDSKLRAPMTWLLKSMNKRWKKTGKIFHLYDYDNMFHSYWSSHDTLIDTYSVENEEYDTLYQYAKTNDITVNSIITTALLRASEELCDVGMAASIRENGYTGMGNYATGVSIKYQYDNKKSFLENANQVQKLIYEKLNNPSKKYFLLQFMGNIEPTLIDAIYFEACGVYSNKTSKSFSKMFGYSGNPKGISITNLTKIPIELKYGDYEITDLVFVPPLVLNAQRIIGVASFGRKMVLSLHLSKDDKVEFHRKFFAKGMEYLKNL